MQAAGRQTHLTPSAARATMPSMDAWREELEPSDPALLGLLRHAWDPNAAVPTLEAADWTGVVRRALEQGVAGLLCSAIPALPTDAVPAEIDAAARSYLARTWEEGAERVRQTFEVLDALAAHGIAALPFKGVALAAVAYGDPTLRPSRDIDVLVHTDEITRAITALGALGYRLGETFGPRVMARCFATYGQDILHAPGRLPVEPHWTFAPSTLAIDIDVEAMWRRQAITCIDGRHVATLSPEDTLLVACLHGAKEKWWRLLWVADLAALVHRHASLDWAAIERRAAGAGLGRVLRMGMALTQALFGTQLPPHLAASIRRDPACLRLLARSVRRLFAARSDPGSPFRLSYYHWQARERLRDRMRYAWRTVTTPQFIHYRMIALPDRLAAGYVPVKVVHDYLLLPVWRLGSGRWWGARTPQARSQ